jgi:OFA family oxalate/formate antiporter-like MFS transporter
MQGLISGLLLMSFGVGSFVIGKLFQDITPSFIGAWRSSFLYLGFFLLLVYIVCSFFLSAPGNDFHAPDPSLSKKHFINPIAIEADAKKMVTKKSFWLYYIWASVMALAGLALVSQAGFIAKEIDPTVSPGNVATVAGLISIFSGIGRLIAGILFDRYGRRLTMRIIDWGFMLTSVLLFTAILKNNFVFMTFGFIIGGFSYGGVPSTSSAFTTYYYGHDNYPINFSLINTNLVIASFGSTIAGALYDLTKSYLINFYFIAGISVVGMILSFSIAVHGKWVEKKYAALGRKVE